MLYFCCTAHTILASTPYHTAGPSHNPGTALVPAGAKADLPMASLKASVGALLLARPLLVLRGGGN